MCLRTHCIHVNLIEDTLGTSSWRHQMEHFPRNWPVGRGIHRSQVVPLTCMWRGASMFSLICAWINGGANNRDAGDLRHHRAPYDITVMCHTKRDYLKKKHNLFWCIQPKLTYVAYYIRKYFKDQYLNRAPTSLKEANFANLLMVLPINPILCIFWGVLEIHCFAKWSPLIIFTWYRLGMCKIFVYWYLYFKWLVIELG